MQRAGDVGVDEVLPRVGGNVRLVQRRGVQDGLDTPHAARHEGAIGNRADVRGEG